MKALVGAFNQEKALVGAFSVIVKTDCETDGALHSTTPDPAEYLVMMRGRDLWRKEDSCAPAVPRPRAQSLPN